MQAARDDLDEVIGQLDVSRETADRLEAYVALLRQWQAVKNLVAPSTLDQVWRRHVLDSAQLIPLLQPLLGPAHCLVDIGSGAGFPGLVLAILLQGRQESETRPVSVHLVESNGRKSAFLRDVIRVTGAPAIVHGERIEDFMHHPPGSVAVVTARALAPLADLLSLSEGLLKTGTQALFLKGQDVGQELTQAGRSWRIEANLIPSITDPSGRIVHVVRAERLLPRG